MRRNPDVSIIVPTHNDEAWIAAALDSCIAQKLTDIEVICVDDASSDGTPRIIREYAARDERIRLIALERNSSALQARRAGVEAARAPYALFLDGDDELTPDAAKTALALAKEHDADIVGFGVDIILPEGLRPPTFEEGLQPVHEKLSGSDVVGQLFTPEMPAHGHIWGYLFATGLLRRTYEAIPADAYVPRANDLPVTFLTIAEASSYVSTPKRLYRYFFRRGASGHRVTSVDDFRFYLGAISAIELIEPAVREIAAAQPDDSPVLPNYRSARLSIIGTVLGYCAGAVDDALQDECLELVREHVSDEDISAAVASFRPEALPLLRRASLRQPVAQREVKSVVVTTADLSTGGVQGVVISQAAYLRDAGMRVTIVVHRESKKVYDVPDGVEVRLVEGAGMAERLASWTEICRDVEADVVIDHWVLYNRNWPYYVMASRKAGIPTIGCIQSFALRPVLNDNELTSFLVDNMPLLRTVTTLSATDVAFWKLRGIPHVVTIPNPPSPMLRQIPERTEPKQPPSGRLKLVWWGRLQQSTKQARILIPIAAALRARGVDFELAIIGPDSADLTAETMREDAIAYGVEDIVSVPGPLHGPALIEALESSDIYVTTSVIEGSPLALIEAQTFGLPVVMFDLPWLANLVGNEGVITVPQGDVREMARQLDLIAQDPQRYVELSAGSLAAARRSVDFDFVELYTRLAKDELPAEFSPEPTLDHARLLLEWISWYGERNSRLHERQSKATAKLYKQRAELRDKVVASRQTARELRKEIGDLRARAATSRTEIAQLRKEVARLRSRRSGAKVAASSVNVDGGVDEVARTPRRTVRSLASSAKRRIRRVLRRGRP